MEITFLVKNKIPQQMINNFDIVDNGCAGNNFFPKIRTQKDERCQTKYLNYKMKVIMLKRYRKRKEA